MEDNAQIENSQPIPQLPTDNTANEARRAAPTKKSNKRLVAVSIVLGLLMIAGIVIIVSFLNPTGTSIAGQSDNNQASASATPTTTPTSAVSATPIAIAGVECGQLSTFADKQVGFSFCYPADWGTTTVKEAKVDGSDNGYRQMIIFSTNQDFSVGGQSQNWSTSVGRGIGCLEPNNIMPSLSDYNTQWHDDYNDGMGMFYSRRSLPSIQGGYAIEESISVGADANGWCVHGHKIIDGSRYKIAFAGFHSSKDMYQTLAENQNNANQFFTPAQRAQYDALLASLKAF